MTPDVDYPPVDYLAIGHICYDLVPGGRVVGGAAAYGASIAHVLGCRAGVVTSGAKADDWQERFPQLAIRQVVAPETTIFENVYTANGRRQTIHAVAGRLEPRHVPPQWTRSAIVHLGPIANEVDPAIITLFSNSVVGVGPQGWMRRWDANGRVYAVDWEAAAEILPLAGVIFVSREDLPHPAALDSLLNQANLLIVTDGANGCTVHFHQESRSFPAPEVRLADATGAGDIFAAAYLVRLLQTDGNIWDAAAFANRIASISVTRRGLAAKLEAIRHEMANDTRRPAVRY